MIVVRAWPDDPPAGRARIVDDWPRVPVDDYDYRNLAGVGDDVISLDWDQAIGLEELHAFAERARREPERPLVAPCRIYCDGAVPMREPCWNAKVYNPGFTTMRLVDEGEPFCHLFGFGMVYLPAALIAAYLAGPGERFAMNDTSFSGWHHKNVGAETPIDWRTRPVHLHYPVPPGGKL